MIKKLLTILFLILLPAIGVCAPSISSVTGTIQTGESITISGSSFGSGPTVVIFDDFEGVAGNNIPTSSPQVGSWSSAESYPFNPIYDSNSYSGDTGFRMFNGVDGGQRQFKKNFGGDKTELFISYMVRVPDGTYFPNTTSTETFATTLSVWKFTWVADDDGYVNDDDLWDMCIPTWVGSGGFYIAGNAGNFGVPPTPASSWWSWTSWMNIQFWSTGTDSNGEASWESMSSEKGYTKKTWGYPFFSPYSMSNQRFDSIVFPGWVRSTADQPNVRPVYDDVYVAVGPHSAARVQLGNASTLSSCTKMAMATPTSWASGEITATVWEGGFNDSDSVYVFVFDDQNHVSPGDGPYTFVGGGVPPAELPTVNITTVDSSLLESDGDTVVATVDCDEYAGGETNCNDLVVSFTLAGTATEGTDYAAIDPQTVRISDASTPASISIDPQLDGVFDGDETLSITLSNDTAYNIGTPGSSEITISNVDLLDFTYEVWGEQSQSNNTGTCTDTYINYFEDSQNFSDLNIINVYTSPDNTASQNAVLHFDLSAIPVSATIASAELCLFVDNYAGSNPGTFPITAHKITRSNSINDETWLTYDGVNAWTSAGGDYAAYEDETASDLTQYSRTCWDIPLMVQDWVTTPATNYGVLLRESSISTNLSDRDISFMSSNYPNADYRPTLEINWSASNEGSVNFGGSGSGGVFGQGSGSIN